MKSYNLDSEFTFGKYAGKSIRQIMDLQPSYLDWCVNNLDHFYIAENMIEEIKKIKPGFKLSAEGIQKMNEKFAIWEQEQEQEEEYSNDYRNHYEKDDDDSNADYNQTDWSDYNDNLDMDQQSIEFWNQF
jgi:hypothetical protein